MPQPGRRVRTWNRPSAHAREALFSSLLIEWKAGCAETDWRGREADNRGATADLTTYGPLPSSAALKPLQDRPSAAYTTRLRAKSSPRPPNAPTSLSLPHLALVVKMPSFDRVYASSPVLAIPAQTAHPVSLDKSFLQHQILPLSQPASWRPQLVRTCTAAGRKRSRDEASVNLDPPEKLVELPVKEPEDEWVYGPGMTLIKKSAGYVADASNQSGTWLEERAAAEEARKTEAALLAQEQLAQSRPSLRSHKSQRLDMTTTSISSDGMLSGCRSSPTREAINPMTASSDSLAQPIVDDFTLHLGIGWSRISDNEHIQAAARGWARFIENHYPVTNAKILLESRGLQSYLVEATEGYFLFAENLRQGRLVSTTSEGALDNLKVSPPVFDGLEIMNASASARSPDSIASTTSADIDMS
ncbi:hypothetical protein L209DRAFT_765671 [Thermothelomyces heterothallicus CBS 203.75]